MKIEKRRYRITGIEPIMGSQPADPDVRATYIASKANSPEQAQEENEFLDGIDETKGLTIFLRDPESGAICLLDYMFIGYLKEAVHVLAADNGVKMAASKVGMYVFVAPRVLKLRRNDVIITEEDRVLSRPLRAQTMQGPRVALASSEVVDLPWGFEIEISLINNNGTAKSSAITFDIIEEALDYGRFKGLAQWRNGGYGRFTWERIG